MMFTYSSAEPPLTPETTVNEAVRRFPATLAVFARVGIDTCCGGGLAIADAARRHAVDPAALLAELEEVSESAAPQIITSP